MHQQLLHHAIAADDFKIVVDLLTNLPWIEIKLKASNNSLSNLLRDYDLCESRLDDRVNIIKSYLLDISLCSYIKFAVYINRIEYIHIIYYQDQ